MENLVHVDLYTDGACSQNGTWLGGYGAILICGGHEKEISGYRENTTNNQMELLAVIEGLKALKTKVNVTVYTDSAYVHNAFANGWVEMWHRSGWKTSQNKPVANQELWQELIDLCSKHNVSWKKVQGHADNVLNNRCDKLATEQIKLHAKDKE